MIKYIPKGKPYKIEGTNLYGFPVEVTADDESFVVEFKLSSENDAAEIYKNMNDKNLKGFHYLK